MWELRGGRGICLGLETKFRRRIRFLFFPINQWNLQGALHAALDRKELKLFKYFLWYHMILLWARVEQCFFYWVMCIGSHVMNRFESIVMFANTFIFVSKNDSIQVCFLSVLIVLAWPHRLYLNSLHSDDSYRAMASGNKINVYSERSRPSHVTRYCCVPDGVPAVTRTMVRCQLRS